MPYMLPVCPPLALLIANRFTAAIEKAPERTRRASLASAFLLAIAGLAFILFAYASPVQALFTKLLPPELSGFLRFYRPFSPFSLPAIAGILLLFQGLAIAILNIRKGRTTGLSLVITAVSALTLLYSGRAVYEKAYAPGASSKSFASTINRLIRDGDKVAALGYEQGINFYTGKRVILVLDRGELDFGSRQGDQSGWFMEPQQFMALWLSDQRIFCTSDSLVLNLFPLIFKESQIIARRGSRVLLLNRP